MAAFQQAMANMAAPASSSNGNLSIRGSASAGAPSTRTLATALRSAGIGRENSTGMEVDGGAGRPTRNNAKRSGPRQGPLDQTARPDKRRNDQPYARPGSKPTHNNSGPSRRASDGAPPPPNSLAARLSGASNRHNNHTTNHRRHPAGTPPILKVHSLKEESDARTRNQSKLLGQLKGPGMKNWLQTRHIAPGVMDMSKLPEDQWLKQQNIVPPGHSLAPINAGTVFYKLMRAEIHDPIGPIHTLSLANNNFKDLKQVERLAYILPHIRALDLSNNPIQDVQELDILLSRGERTGKVIAGAGSLKQLIELKLNGCTFREKMLAETGGDEKYQHEILKRFPGLLILDGVNLNRIVFPLQRQAKVFPDDNTRAALGARPFTFPADVQGGFIDNEIVRNFVMSFCAKFFPLFDTDRNALLSAYAPNATITASVNALSSRSYQSTQLPKTRGVTFDPWVELPSRNLLRSATSITQRMTTLKSPMNVQDLQTWWRAIPQTRHPLDDPAKWCVDAWILDGEGVSTRLCATIQGEFRELPSEIIRSFSRTFILADAPQGSTPAQAGWPCQVLSDTLIVTTNLGSGAYDNSRSLAVHGVSIQPIQPIPSPHQPTTQLPVNATTPSSGAPDQAALVNQLRQATGMNDQFATMCLAQNGWNYEVALKNFAEIRATIPAEAFQ